MYLNILKRDIKRKKTMNIILLMFTILAAIFVASGLNNVVTVMNGTKYFFDKAGVKDYVVFTQNGDGGVEQILKDSKKVEKYSREICIWATNDNIRHDSKMLESKNNTVLLQPLDRDQFHYFLPDNQELQNIEDGEIYITAGILKRCDLKVGDILDIEMQGTKKSFRIAGEIKDALLGSDLMGITRLLISENDFNEFLGDDALVPYNGRIFHIVSKDTGALSSELADASNVLFTSDRSTIQLSYGMDMLVAMIVLVLSICLIIVSFVILKFVITFSIREEFREIGVMKAIGIRNAKIRSLYIVKYFAMALVGGLLGFFASMPFGKMLIRSVSSKMVLGNENGYLLNVIGTLLVVGLMAFFAYLCTSSVKKLTPVDAIRSGQTGERYHKKKGIRLSKIHAGIPHYMAVNDILSAPKRFFTIVLAFFLCSIFTLGVVLVSSTMRSDSLISCLAQKTDVYITDSKMIKLTDMSKDGEVSIKQKYKEIKEDLETEGMPVENVSMEIWYKYSCFANGKKYSIVFQQNTEAKPSDCEYIEGVAPENVNEIAITPQIGEQLGIEIGDTITIDFGTETRECIVTAKFQSMNQFGKVARLHPDAPTSMEYSNAVTAYQIDFADHPDKKENDARIQKIKDMYGITGVFDAAGFCVNNMGVADTMDAVGFLLLGITGIVVILVTILMERSFISAEEGQIALLKAIGFTNGSIFRWHVIRLMLVAVFAELLAVVLTVPVTRLWCNPIWKMMGVVDVTYYFNPVRIILIYPGIILAITFAAVCLTALYTRKIHGTDIVNVE